MNKMLNKTRAASFWTLALVILALAGCNNQQPSPNSAPTAQSSEETFKDFGDYELHFNALRTDQLSADVARSYGIERSKNSVLFNITVLRKNADGKTQPVDAEVSVEAHNLNGQTKDATARRVSEGEAIYYIGTVSINGSEILVFDVHATPAGEQRKLDLKFKREFFAD